MSKKDVLALLQDTVARLSVLDNPKYEASLLLEHFLGQTKAWLIANSDAAVTCEQTEALSRAIEARCGGMPMAYITGTRAFWNDNFIVNTDTLIPRPETELLVEAVLEHHSHEPRQVLDLGTGSGCIAVSLAGERPDWSIVAVDLSNPALVTAKRNGFAHHNLSYLNGSWGSAFADESMDTIVCNPPYIAPNDEHLPALRFEPVTALVSSNRGLADIEQVALDAGRCLKNGGTLFLEHGYDQQDEVCRILGAQGFTTETRRDLGDQPRLVIATLEKPS